MRQDRHLTLSSDSVGYLVIDSSKNTDEMFFKLMIYCQFLNWVGKASTKKVYTLYMK